MRAILHHRAILQKTRTPLQVDKQSTTAPQAKCSIPKQRAAALTISCDFMFLMVTAGAAIVFRTLVFTLWPESGDNLEKSIVEWLPILVLLGLWFWFLGTDAARCIQPFRRLPFECTERVVWNIYMRRMEISLWIIASSLVLLCLCLFFGGSPLVSKLFLSSVVALIILTVRKSIPFGRLSVAIAVGIFLSSIVAITILSKLMISAGG